MEATYEKITLLSFIFVFIVSSSVLASEWAYHFVVWDGKQYEVKEEEIIEESEIGKRIGKVKTEPYYSSGYSDRMKYYGNASNVYPKGTPYYEIKGIPTSTSIAVKVDDQWVKVDYVRKAPFHIMNIVTSLYLIVPVVLIGLIFIGFIYRARKKR